jgi:hypothetical protein
MRPNSSLRSDRKYLFSDSQNDKNLYLKNFSLEEMNSSLEIREMVANTAFRAAENYKKIDPTPELTDYSRFHHYEKTDADLPLIKDSNIHPDNIRGFVLEDDDGKAVSIILAGVTKNPLRIMMGTIDTVDECEGRGYFSILFDEVIKEVAQENHGQMPEIGISMRNLTSRGKNFDTYAGITKSRGFDMQCLKREINPQKKFIPLNDAPENVFFQFNREADYARNFAAARGLVRTQPNEALFLHGKPTAEMTLENFSQDSKNRLQRKIASAGSVVLINEVLRTRNATTAQALTQESNEKVRS